MKVSYTTNIKDVINDFEKAARDTPKAVVNALNKTIAKVKTQASKEVLSAGYKLKSADIKASIKILEASTGRLRAEAVASGRSIPLIKYGAVDMRPEGVRVNVLNGRKTLAHAFIANTKNGRQVFERVKGGKHKKVMKDGKAIWSGLPIRKLNGPSIPDALRNKAVERAVTELIVKDFPRIFASQLEWLAKNLKQ